MKIIVDTNIVFSALLSANSRIGSLLMDSRSCYEFYSCKYLQKELYNHLPKIQKSSKLNDEQLFELLNLLESHIFFVDEALLPQAALLEAKDLVEDVDFDDLPFVALTIYLNGLLWTGDKRLINGLRSKGYQSLTTTPELVAPR